MLPDLLAPLPSLTPLVEQALPHRCQLTSYCPLLWWTANISPQSHPYTHSEWPLFCKLRKNHPTHLPLGIAGNVLRKPHHP